MQRALFVVSAYKRTDRQRQQQSAQEEESKQRSRGNRNAVTAAQQFAKKVDGESDTEHMNGSAIGMNTLFRMKAPPA